MASDDDQELVIDEGPGDHGESGGEDTGAAGPYTSYKDLAGGGFKAEQTFASILEKCYKAVQAAKDGAGRRRSLIFMNLPDKQQYPDYFETIKKPIAMVHIRGHMRRQRYKYIKQFFQDFLLMFQNAKLYNQEGSQIYEDATALQIVLENEIRKHFPDFDARAAAIEWKQLADEPPASSSGVGAVGGGGASAGGSGGAGVAAASASGAGAGAVKRPAEGALEAETKRAHAPVKLFHCPECGVGFSRQQNLRRHSQQFHSEAAAEGDTSRRGGPAKDSPYPAAAQTVLDNLGSHTPMHYRDITRKAMEQGLIKPLGRTPENTMHGQLNKSDIFTPMGRGLFGLAKWGLTPPPTTPRPTTTSSGLGTPVAAHLSAPTPHSFAASPAVLAGGSAVASPAPLTLGGSGIPDGSSPPAMPAGDGDSDSGSDGEPEDPDSDATDEATRAHRALMQSIPLSSLHRAIHVSVAYAQAGRKPSSLALLRRIMGFRDDRENPV
eukprot:m.37854 g.37854  ORF g.37854 m.37854 type:complete len:493 (+) comp9882_c0_seq1:12-1490(+)